MTSQQRRNSRTVTWFLVLVNVFLVYRWRQNHRTPSLTASQRQSLYGINTAKKTSTTVYKQQPPQSQQLPEQSKTASSLSNTLADEAPASASASATATTTTTVIIKERAFNISLDTRPRAAKIILPPDLPTPSALQQVRTFTSPSQESHLISPAGVEPYALYYYLTSTYGGGSMGGSHDPRAVLDIGTRYAASALALAAGGSPVISVDLGQERFFAFRRRPYRAWILDLIKTVPNVGSIEFYNTHLLQVKDLRQYLKEAWLIVLDTNALPDSDPFEREFFQRLLKEAPDYQGLLLLDDIHANAEMEKWWQEVRNGATQHGYRVFDLTKIGHSSGTGLVDFSGLCVVHVEPP